MSLKYRKLDLHIHTPASHDFNDKKVTAEQIIKQAIDKDLDAIAVTDHNTVDFVDELKGVAKKQNFTVFPGIEISCGGSVSGSIHVIGIFDVTASKDDLQKIIGQLGIKGSGENALTSKSVSDVIDIIKDAGGLSVLAHANSSHGALQDIRGNPRTDIVKNKNLYAVEATAGDFQKEIGKRLIDILDGEDPTYGRHLPVYQSSDNRSKDGKGHCLESIGSSYSYFKMGELTLESLRQCFEDPASRILQSFDADKVQASHPVIKSLTITGGFLDGQTFYFDRGMNSLIGGTGTGKSLVVEYIRYVLGLEPKGAILTEHKEKLLKTLGIGSQISLVFVDNSGDEYEVSRKLESMRDIFKSPIVCINTKNQKRYEGNISSIFPVLVYSQNEILEITRDNNAQLKLLDNFRDFESYRNKVESIKSQLGALDRKLIQSLEDSKQLQDLIKQSKTFDEKLEKLENQLTGVSKTGKPDPFLQLSKEKASIEEKIDAFDVLDEKISDTIDDFKNECPGKLSKPNNLEDKISEDLRLEYLKIIDLLEKEKVNNGKLRLKAEAELKKWVVEKKFKEVEAAYQLKIKAKKQQQELEGNRKDILNQKKSLTPKITNAERASKTYTEIREDRKRLLEEMQNIRDQYYNERQSQAKLINGKSNDKLKIIVEAADNKTAYLSRLNAIKTGSYAEKKEIENIVNTVTPVELIESALDNDISKFAELCSVKEEKAENILNALMNPSNLSNSLALQYEAFPQDVVQINYKKKDNKHCPLSELSMGQKADALVMIALGDGQMPVIIDQPEDALDVPSIWADICTKLRINKHSRQFIFTTHNSSISVSSDSDQFIVMKADGEKGWIAKAGSIDEPNIKDDIVDHLEGGVDAYDLKRRKLGL